jgi:alpha-L-fucosidase
MKHIPLRPSAPNARFAAQAAVFLFSAWVAPFVAGAFTLPDLPAMPTIPAPQTPGTVTMGDPANYPEVQMDFPIETGTFQDNWPSLLANYPSKDSAWLRQAKFGIWVHFGPQAAGHSGDWYARRMYIQGQAAYNNHITDYGHPSQVGYKDLIESWKPDYLDPVALTNLYHDAGARFLMVQGVHHDQYDNWNSKYQPWNSKNLAPNRDFLAEWRDAIRAKGDMRFGVTFHHEYSWWWWQSCYRADTSGTYQGVPYDGNLTASDATATWNGKDLRKLYITNLREYIGIYNQMDMTGYNLSQGIFVNHLEFAHWYATWWALRIMDVIENYDPDFIYTDGNSTQPFSGNMSGSGYKCTAMPRVRALDYNRTLERRGKVDTFGIVKFNPNPKAIVNTYESTYPGNIVTSQPWIGEVPVGDWYYGTGFNYNAGMVIRYLLECVSRDGAAAINIPIKPDGTLESACTTMLHDIGAWMTINGNGIYGSRAWVKFGDGSRNLPTGNLGNNQANYAFTTGDFRYTVGSDGYLYAFCMTVPSGGTVLSLPALGSGSANLAAPITSVELLGSTDSIVFTQTSSALSITCPSSMPFQTAVCFRIGPASIVLPQTPTDLTATPSPSSIALNWNSSLSDATFSVMRSTSLSGSYSSIATGISSTTFTDTTAVAGTPYFYKVAAIQGGATSPYSAVAPAVLSGTADPAWQSRDIGAVGAAGGFVQSGASMLVNGSGADIWGTADEFRYVYQPLTGDGTITAKVECVTNTNGWAKGGVMIRESLDANSRYVIAFMSPSNGTALQNRTSTGGSAAGVSASTGLSAPYWIRLKRTGNTFDATQSSDGVNWTSLGSTTVSMASNGYIGLAVSSHADGSICQALFSNISVKNSFSPSLSGSAGNTTACLSWSSVAGATGYLLKRSSAPGGPYTNLTTSPGSAFIDTGLTNGSTYYYVVSALNGSTVLGDSDEVSVAPSNSSALVSRATGGTALANADKSTETAAMAFDGTTSTKWFTDVLSNTGWIQYHFGNGQAWRITEYKITSANDVQQRDPKDWQFQGSNDGVTWTTLDTRTNQVFATRLTTTNTYDFANTTPYSFYRLNITNNYGGSGYQIQLSELAMLSSPSDAGDKTPPVLSLPSNLTLSATTEAGTAATFAPTATDVVSGSLAVICTPPSGSVFVPGTTTVQCSATDAAGNTASGSFTVTVNSPVMTWRQQYFGTSDNSGTAADNADPDGDGWTNAQEFAAGTDPNDRTSRLKIGQVQSSGSGMVVSFPTTSGKTYRVEYSTSLQSGSWTSVQDNIAGTGSVVQVTDSGAVGQTKRFYRIVVH